MPQGSKATGLETLRRFQKKIQNDLDADAGKRKIRIPLPRKKRTLFNNLSSQANCVGTYRIQASNT
ncbi:hypothetical protein CWI77_10185 [Pseudidiomarina planktonica]|nr:hypothetical protein CWI77_10185 [Pseudidiomarina planktonica]